MWTTRRSSSRNVTGEPIKLSYIHIRIYDTWEDLYKGHTYLLIYVYVFNAVCMCVVSNTCDRISCCIIHHYLRRVFMYIYIYHEYIYMHIYIYFIHVCVYCIYTYIHTCLYLYIYPEADRIWNWQTYSHFEDFSICSCCIYSNCCNLALLGPAPGQIWLRSLG